MRSAFWKAVVTQSIALDKSVELTPQSSHLQANILKFVGFVGSIQVEATMFIYVVPW